MIENKDTSIITLIDELKSAFGDSVLKFVDYWESDRCSVGVMNERITDRMIYISTFNKDVGFYAYESECGDIANADTKIISKSDRVNFLTLRKEIADFLKM